MLQKLKNLWSGGIWEKLSLVMNGMLAVDVGVLLINILRKRTIWEMPIFHLWTGVILLCALVFYLLVREKAEVTGKRKKILLGVTVAGFLMLFFTSGLSIVLLFR